MADGNKQDKSSEGNGCVGTQEEKDEDEEEIEFPFNLSEEWMVIDVDEDEEEDDDINRTDSLAKDSYDEKDGVVKSQAKEPQNSDTASSSYHKNPKKSTEKPGNLKEKGTTQSTPQTPVKSTSSQGNKAHNEKERNVHAKSISNQSPSNVKDTSVGKKSQEDKRDTKAPTDKNVPSKSLSNQSSCNVKGTSVDKKSQENKKDTSKGSTDKNLSSVKGSTVNTRAASNTNAKKIEKPSGNSQISQQTVKSFPGKTAQSPKSSNSKTPSSPKTQKLPEKTSIGMMMSSMDLTSKTAHPESSKPPTRNTSSGKTQKLPDKTSGKANNSTNLTSKSSSAESAASSTKPSTPQKTSVKVSSGKTDNGNSQISKSSLSESSTSSTKPSSPQKTPKPSDKASSGKTNNSTKQISNSSQPESSASSPKPSPSQKTQKSPNKASAVKTSNGANQTATSAASQITQTQKGTLGKATSKKLSSDEQSQVSSKTKDGKSTVEKVTVSNDNKSMEVKVNSSSAPSVSVSSSETKPTKERMTTSETETKTMTRSSTLKKVSENAASHQVPSSSSVDAVSKAHGVTERAKNDASPRFKTPDSNRISQKDVKASEVKPMETKPSHVTPDNQKSSQKQMKPVRNSESTGEIAEAMASGAIESCDIQVHDLDLEETKGGKKGMQSKPVQSSALSPKKRPSQNNCETVVKKAKYEEKGSGIHFQDSKEISSTQKDDIKGSKPTEKDLSVNKQSAKRIVRRFHRTTQTVPKTTANQLSQCSLGQPSSGSSSKKQQSNVGIQCKIGGHFKDIMSRISSHLNPVVNTLSQEVFRAVLAFDASPINPDIVTSAPYKYGLRLGQISSSDVEKNFFKDNCIKKADSFSIGFWKKDCGIVDLLFYEEETFISVLNQIRKSRLESRYLCISIVQRNTDEERDAHNVWDYLKATVILDQNFVSTGYLSYYKTPIWSKPKVDEFITMHNVPGGVPLSFLNMVFPDAITVLMRDVKVQHTMKGSGVRLGMSRKNGSSGFLKLFKQVLINNSPVVLTQGVSDRRDIPALQETSKVVAELEKVERERQKEKLSLRSVTSTPRDICGGIKKTKGEGKESSPGTISSPANNVKKDTGAAKQDVNSDLSDISELSFNANNLDSGREVVKSSRSHKEPPAKKIDSKRSLNVTVGSKLLNKARSNLHQAQSKRQEKLRGRKPLKFSETRRSPKRRSNRTREDSPRRSGTTSSRLKDSRRDERRRRDEPLSRRSGSLHRDRHRSHQSREKKSNDRSSQGSGSRFGQRRLRDQDRNRAKHDQSPVRPYRRPRSNNRSPEREVLVGASNRMPRSQERHVEGERLIMREVEGNSYVQYGHLSPPMRDSRERRISLHNANELMANLHRSSEDLRSVLDARKPRSVMLSPGRHGSEEHNRFDSPGRQRRSRSPERRKRPLSRSPSPRYRKVMIGRRSLSPKIRSRRHVDDAPQPRSRQSPRPGMDLMARDAMRGKAPDFRSAQAALQSREGGEPATKEDSMRISKSLFVKLLTNALHGEGGEDGDEESSKTTRSYSPHRDDAERMLSRIRNHEPHSGRDDKSHGNIDCFDKYLHIEQKRSDYEEDRSHHRHSRASKDNYEHSRLSGSDIRPIPPPVLPPILTPSSASFPVNKFDPPRPEERPSSSSSQISQGVWAVPSSQSFSFPPSNVRPPSMSERPPFPPPNRESMPPPQSHPPFNTQPPAMFMNTRPPFQPPPGPGPVPNFPRGIPPPRAGMWQNPRPGPF